jgi:hypothetical protein
MGARVTPLGKDPQHIDHLILVVAGFSIFTHSMLLKSHKEMYRTESAQRLLD